MYRVLNRSKEPRNHHDFLYAIGVRRSILETSEWVSAVRNPERREQNSDYHLEPGDPQKEDRRGIACMPVGRASSCAVKPRVRALIIVSTLGKKFRQYNHGFMITEGI